MYSISNSNASIPTVGPENNEIYSLPVEQQIVISVPVEANQFKEFTFNAPGVECKECKLKVKTKSQ